MSGKHDHAPAGEGRTEPYRPGERGRCHRCGREIVFIEGFELRRDYWRKLPKIRA